MAAVLQTQGLVKQFGGIIATNDVSLSVEKGARHALIGPNGAGKTTVINLLTGVLRPTAGRIMLEGRDITPRSDIFALGAVLYEMATGRRAFPGRTQASIIASVLASDPPAAPP